ncbi:MAG: metallophosphoesterase [Eubacteriales bacterium]|nr:metallophosphoesterase [Eubacteriales bacterium]
MREIKILCSSDWHLDSPFEGLSASKAGLRRNEQSELLETFVQLARQERVDLVLLGGDLLSSRCSCYETGETLVRALRGIDAPVFIAPGESDAYTPRCPYACLRLSENVHVFTDSEITCAELPELGVRVFGAAHTGNTAPTLDGFCAVKADGFYNLLCLYGEYGLEMSGIDFASLGGRHSASGLKKVGDTWYSYSGCPQGRSFEECGERYVSIVRLSENGCSAEQHSLGGRQYKTLEVDVTGREPLIALHTSIPDDTLSDIYRIVLTGECAAAPDLNALHASLAELFFDVKLVDRTKLSHSIWDKAQEDTLRGIFLRKLREKYDNTDDLREKEMIGRAARWGLSALDNGKEVAAHENK